MNRPTAQTTDEEVNSRSVLSNAGALVATAITLVAATAAGALLLAISSDGTVTLTHLLTTVAAPAAIALVVVVVLAAAMRWRRLMVGILTGFWTGLVATIGLEVVREIGFRGFHSMPGDLPKLIGIKVLGRMVMQGPDLSSNLAGWGFHFWNGAMFGIIYVLLVGGFPRRHAHRKLAAAGIGAFYGALLGTGFLLSPLSRVTGAGIFGSISGPPYVITVYAAHLMFGAILGLLTHHFARKLSPIWTPVLNVMKAMMRRPVTTQPASSSRIGT